MSNQRNQDLLELQEKLEQQRLFEEQLAAEGKALWEAFLAEQQAGTAPEIPDELDRKCRKIIQSAGKAHKREVIQKRIGNALKRAAVFALVILPIASVLVMNVDAVKVPVVNYFIENRDRYSSLIFRREPPPEQTETSRLDEVLSVALPDGFVLDRIIELPDGTSSLYFSNQNSAIIHVYLSHSNGIMNYDTEDVEQVPVELYNHKAIYLNKKGHRIIWINEAKETLFDVSTTNLSEDDFWKYIYRLAK